MSISNVNMLLHSNLQKMGLMLSGDDNANNSQQCWSLADISDGHQCRGRTHHDLGALQADKSYKQA